MSVETKKCRVCDSNFQVDQEDLSFYSRMEVPVPGLCPACRFRRRAGFRNERTLYKRTCGLCERSIISMYHPESPYIVYCHDCWYSNKWDPSSYAMEYDPARPFLDQLQDLFLSVPKISLMITMGTGPSINSEYTNMAGGNKNCYLLFNAGPKNEDCGYSRGMRNNNYVYDAYFTERSEMAYEAINLEKSSGVAYAQNVADCLDSWFLLDCVGAQKCFGCVNLRHGSFKFLNEDLDKEEWRRRTSEIFGSHKAVEDFKVRFEEHCSRFPRKENSNFKCVDSTGNYLIECKNAKDCFEVAEGENIKYCFAARHVKDSYDILGYGSKSELLLECVACGVGNRMKACVGTESGHDFEYCFMVRSGEHCLGCDGLKNGSYSILNKRYAPGEYKELRRRIVDELAAAGEYGLFFPPSMAMFAYNETIGMDNMPMDRGEAIRAGFRWQENMPETRGSETMKSEDIPDRIQDVPDSILNETLACVSCGKNYRLIKPELDFYRKAVIPVPRRCFGCRHAERLEKRGPMLFFDRACAKCSKAIRTNFAPDRPDVVYCEQCYQKEVV